MTKCTSLGNHVHDQPIGITQMRDISPEVTNRQTEVDVKDTSIEKSEDFTVNASDMAFNYWLEQKLSERGHIKGYKGL